MTAFHILADAQGAVPKPKVNRIALGDLADALRAGIEDFVAMPSHIIFIVIMYPLIGVVLAAWTSTASALPLIFPLASGFALIGPFAAIGLYEISRRREVGIVTRWQDALEVRKSPALPAIAWVGAVMVAIFIAWMLVAQGLYVWLFGPVPPGSITEFATNVFYTSEGWTLIVLGNLAGFVFAVAALCTGIVSFPLLLDRDVGAWAAISTSWRAAAANPVEVAAWGLVVAALLVIGSIPVFAGLIIVLPVLGHATWHLYRKLVAPE
ncbi:MAG: DUF2189 domain-containing protein [Rhizobiaceae bacterium]|nr:DUF2189 domain-containing protein [Rhizobiaceae bacterium]